VGLRSKTAVVRRRVIPSRALLRHPLT